MFKWINKQKNKYQENIINFAENLIILFSVLTAILIVFPLLGIGNEILNKLLQLIDNQTSKIFILATLITFYIALRKFRIDLNSLKFNEYEIVRIKAIINVDEFDTTFHNILKKHTKGKINKEKFNKITIKYYEKLNLSSNYKYRNYIDDIFTKNDDFFSKYFYIYINYLFINNLDDKQHVIIKDFIDIINAFVEIILEYELEYEIKAKEYISSKLYQRTFKFLENNYTKPLEIIEPIFKEIDNELNINTDRVISV